MLINAGGMLGETGASTLRTGLRVAGRFAFLIVPATMLLLGALAGTVVAAAHHRSVTRASTDLPGVTEALDGLAAVAAEQALIDAGDFPGADVRLKVARTATDLAAPAAWRAQLATARAGNAEAYRTLIDQAGTLVLDVAQLPGPISRDVAAQLRLLDTATTATREDVTADLIAAAAATGDPTAIDASDQFVATGDPRYIVALLRTVEGLGTDTANRVGAATNRATVWLTLAITVLIASVLVMTWGYRRVRHDVLGPSAELEVRAAALAENLPAIFAGARAPARPVGSLHERDDDVGAIASALHMATHEAERLHRLLEAERAQHTATLAAVARRQQATSRRLSAAMLSAGALESAAVRAQARAADNLLVLTGRSSVGNTDDSPTDLESLISQAAADAAVDALQIRTVPLVILDRWAVGPTMRILVELLDNAALRSSGAAPITVSGEHRRDGTVTVTLADGGFGMAPDALAHWNDILASDGRDVDGTGGRFGLLTVAALARRLNGQVDLAPSRHGGVAATLSLPPTTLHGHDGAPVTVRPSEPAAVATGTVATKAPRWAPLADAAMGLLTGFWDPTTTTFRAVPRPASQPPGADLRPATRDAEPLASRAVAAVPSGSSGS